MTVLTIDVNEYYEFHLFESAINEAIKQLI